jgi:hypothetical protein
VAASTALLDRAHGRPGQSIQAKIETAAAFAVAMIPETATKDEWLQAIEGERANVLSAPDS